jgi:hypothetical protein
MRPTTGRDDRGAAALELSLFLVLIFAVLLLIAPLGNLMREQRRLQHAAADTVRFATAAPNTAAVGSSARRPSMDDIRAEARRALTDAGSEPPVGWELSNVTANPEPPLLPQEELTITLSEDVDLGGFGWLMDITGLVSDGTVHVTAHATAVEE